MHAPHEWPNLMSEWSILGTLGLFSNVELSKLVKDSQREARHEVNRLQDANSPICSEDPRDWATVCD